MTLVEGEELQRLWTLVSELSSQLSANQQLCQQLQQQADELKGHALHSGTGYSLRRFNLDISKEQFETELEKTNAQLVVENQTLAHENKQINLLLREHESTLETIMAKFRSFSHVTQQHTLELTSHYETLLANNEYEVANADLRANTAFSGQLSHLGSLVRLALREVEGEGSSHADDGEVEEGIEDAGDEKGKGKDDELHDEHDKDPFATEGYRVGSPSGVGPSRPAMASNSKKKQRQVYGSADAREARWHGTGGYTGLQGDPDAEIAVTALEARTEEERLWQENEMLREMLRISTDLPPDQLQVLK